MKLDGDCNGISFTLISWIGLKLLLNGTLPNSTSSICRLLSHVMAK